jgi:hypothetical protein
MINTATEMDHAVKTAQDPEHVKRRNKITRAIDEQFIFKFTIGYQGDKISMYSKVKDQRDHWVKTLNSNYQLPTANEIGKKISVQNENAQTN